MPSLQRGRFSGAQGLLVVACALAPFSKVQSVQAKSAARCLAPAAGHALEEAVAAGALQPALGGDFTFAGASLETERITLAIEDHAHHSYKVALVLPESRRGEPDGKGRRFLFYLEPPEPAPPNPEAMTALRAAAAIFDQAIRETAIVDCAGATASTPALPAAHERIRRHEGPITIPRSVALAVAMLQVAILTAVIARAFTS